MISYPRGSPGAARTRYDPSGTRHSHHITNHRVCTQIPAPHLPSTETPFPETSTPSRDSSRTDCSPPSPAALRAPAARRSASTASAEIFRSASCSANAAFASGRQPAFRREMQYFLIRHRRIQRAKVFLRIRTAVSTFTSPTSPPLTPQQSAILCAMASTINISLPEPLSSYVAAKIAARDYGTPGQYITELIQEAAQPEGILKSVSFAQRQSKRLRSLTKTGSTATSFPSWNRTPHNALLRLRILPAASHTVAKQSRLQREIRFGARSTLALCGKRSHSISAKPSRSR